MKTTNIKALGAPTTDQADYSEIDYILQSAFSNDVEEPLKKPEVEPDKTPDENPGIITEPKPEKEEEEDDDDDDDDYEPSFPEPEIGDDPDEIKTRTTIM